MFRQICVKLSEHVVSECDVRLFPATIKTIADVDQSLQTQIIANGNLVEKTCLNLIRGYECVPILWFSPPYNVYAVIHAHMNLIK